jgi:hypothetical protein
MGLQRESEVSLASGAAAIRWHDPQTGHAEQKHEGVNAKACALGCGSFAGRDATGGAQRASLAKMVRYYRTHLAINAKRIGSEKRFSR